MNNLQLKKATRKKVKDMEKGAERDKKMAALKQFIKKPELINVGTKKQSKLVAQYSLKK